MEPNVTAALAAEPQSAARFTEIHRKPRAQKLAESAQRRAKSTKDRREKNLERYALDVADAPEMVADERRRLRNARKKERRG